MCDRTRIFPSSCSNPTPTITTNIDTQQTQFVYTERRDWEWDDCLGLGGRRDGEMTVGSNIIEFSIITANKIQFFAPTPPSSPLSQRAKQFCFSGCVLFFGAFSVFAFRRADRIESVVRIYANSPGASSSSSSRIGGDANGMAVLGSAFLRKASVKSLYLSSSLPLRVNNVKGHKNN